MYNEINLDSIDLCKEPPEKEPERQYYFMAKCREWVCGFEEKNGRRPCANIKTFGCQMNARDSEKISGILDMIGFAQTEGDEADLLLFNTCTVRENANLKVYGRLGQLKRIKANNPDMIIMLCGCMMQERDVVDKIRKSYRNVDVIFGTHNIYKFAELLYEKLSDRQNGMIVDIWEETEKIVEELPSKRKYSFKSGVNIMFGCNNFCSYCIVPYVRGRERSRKPEDIIAEVERLADEGVVEVMLLGQNVNSYGKNLDEQITFAELLRRVEKVEGIKRIRFMTSHPKDLSDELIDVMKTSDKICRQLHLPLQSGSSRLLKLMNRHYDKQDYLELVKKIRTAMPDIALTTDIIVGFPGETEEDFSETMEVVERAQFDSAFTFIYSRRIGTPAAEMDGQIPEAVVKERFDRLLSRVQKISAQKTSEGVGQTVTVLVEEENRGNSALVTGRTDKNYIVHFPGDKSMIGKLVSVKLCESKGFYYFGELVD